MIPKESNRHNKNESRGVKYYVKYADIIDPNIPPMATNDHAYTCNSLLPLIGSLRD